MCVYEREKEREVKDNNQISVNPVRYQSMNSPHVRGCPSKEMKNKGDVSFPVRWRRCLPVVAPYLEYSTTSLFSKSVVLAHHSFAPVLFKTRELEQQRLMLACCFAEGDI